MQYTLPRKLSGSHLISGCCAEKKTPCTGQGPNTSPQATHHTDWIRWRSMVTVLDNDAVLFRATTFTLLKSLLLKIQAKSTLKTEVSRSPETSVTVYQSTRRNTPQGVNVQQHCWENIQPRIFLAFTFQARKKRWLYWDVRLAVPPCEKSLVMSGRTDRLTSLISRSNCVEKGSASEVVTCI
jgi:hypothetical protein